MGIFFDLIKCYNFSNFLNRTITGSVSKQTIKYLIKLYN